jgi:hypothetical protein
MSLISLILVLVVLGLVLYLVNTYIPMDPKIKNIMNVAVVVFLIIWLLQAFGLLDPIRNLRIGR